MSQILLECIVINEAGDQIETEPSKVKLTHKSLVIIISKNTRTIFVFKGKEITGIQKFASAQAASILRLKYGCKIKHIEETEGIDEEFKPILEYLGGIIEEQIPVKEVVIPESEAKTISKPQQKTTTKTNSVKPSSKITAKSKPVQEKNISDQKIVKEKVLSMMKTLCPPEGSTCDYLIIESNLYIVQGKNKNDLRQGEFTIEEISTLPDGVFSVEKYYPRILISNQKVIGIELWIKR